MNRTCWLVLWITGLVVSILLAAFGALDIFVLSSKIWDSHAAFYQFVLAKDPVRWTWQLGVPAIVFFAFALYRLRKGMQLFKR